MSALGVADRKATVDRMIDELGMSLTAVSEQLGVSRTTIANWRRGPAATLQCPECGDPMIEPAARCGFCAAEAEAA